VHVAAAAVRLDLRSRCEQVDEFVRCVPGEHTLVSASRTFRDKRSLTTHSYWPALMMAGSTRRPPAEAMHSLSAAVNGLALNTLRDCVLTLLGALGFRLL